MGKRRVTILVVVLVVVVLVAAASWIAGSTIQSPAEAAARTAPPTPSPILAPVEARLLTSDIVTRGAARYGRPHAISLAPSSLKADLGIVTTLPTHDTDLHEGDVLLTLSGRPVFLLQGDTPTYRDLSHGAAGDDVRQLEEGLQRLGFDPGSVDGTYDEQTAHAVDAWYRSAGWPPFAAADEQLASLFALEQALAMAESDRLTAEAAVAAAPLAVDAARAQADAAGKAATADMAAAESGEAIEAAEAAVTAAQLTGEVAIQAAIDAQQARERDAELAGALVDELTAELESARLSAGVKAPSDEIVFIPVLPVRVEQVDATVGDRARGSLLTVTNNQLAVDSSLPLAEASLVKPGMAVAIDEPDLGIKATGVVERVAGAPGTDGADGYHVYFETLVDETPSTIEGFSLRLTIPVETTGDAVTTVPISALSLAADGSTRVQVQRDGTLDYVVVEPGLSADGFVEVTPIGGMLEPGTLVVIGVE